MEYQEIIYEKKNKVAYITINRPPFNVLTLTTLKEMTSAINDAEKDQDIVAITLRGSGNKAFAAGLDVKDHMPEVMDEMLKVFENTMITLTNSKKITIAVVDGICSGGGFEVVLCCDIIIATEKTNFSLPEINLSLFPGYGIVMLPRKLPRNISFEIITTGDAIDAERAFQIGLINKLVKQEVLDNEVEKFLKKFRIKSIKALELTKYAILRSYDMEFMKALKTIDDIYVGLVMHTEDANEGINSFVEKRKPVWKNR